MTTAQHPAREPIALGVKPAQRSPMLLDCGSVQLVGAWDVSECCGSCHARGCASGGFTVDIGDSESGETIRLEGCCALEEELPLTGEVIARLVALAGRAGERAAAPVG